MTTSPGCAIFYPTIRDAKCIPVFTLVPFAFHLLTAFLIMSVSPKLSYEDWLKLVFNEGYRGYITNRNFSSIAKASEWFSLKNNRMIYSASPPEKRHHMNLEFDDDISSYYDQFPIPPEITLRICERHGLRHHGDGGFVVTIDAVPFYKSLGVAQCHSVKSDAEIDPLNESDRLRDYKRLKELLLIEMLSAEELKMEFCLIADAKTPKTRFENLEWMYSGNNTLPKEREKLDVFIELFISLVTSISKSTKIKLKDIQKAVGKRLRLSIHSVKRLFALMCWRKVINFDLHKFLQPLSDISCDTFLFDLEVYKQCRVIEITKSVTPYRL